MIEIGVIDDDQMLLQGMAAWIGSTGDIRLTATAASVEDYLGTADIPKIVILDLNLGNYTDPVRNVAQLVGSGLQVIVASVIPDRAYIAATTEAGRTSRVAPVSTTPESRARRTCSGGRKPSLALTTSS